MYEDITNTNYKKKKHFAIACKTNGNSVPKLIKVLTGIFDVFIVSLQFCCSLGSL